MSSGLRVLIALCLGLVVQLAGCQRAASSEADRGFARAAAAKTTVVDEQGKPIPKFEVMFYSAETGSQHWGDGIDGTLPEPYMFDEARIVDVIVRASGYAATAYRLSTDDAASGQGGDKIVLKCGSPVELHLRFPPGMEWPKSFSPEVYFAFLGERAEMLRQPSAREQIPAGAKALDFNMPIESKAPGSYEIRLSDDTPPFLVGIHVPGLLQYFDAGPFTIADVKDGKLEVEVPQPATIEFNFEPNGDQQALPFAGASLTVLGRSRYGAGSFKLVANVTSANPNLHQVLADLSPGEYRCELGTHPQPGTQSLPGTDVNPGKYHDIRIIRLAAGETKRIDALYEPPNLESFRGDRTATLRFENTNGKPAAGESIVVKFNDPHYRPLTVFDGKVPESGELVLAGLHVPAEKDWFQTAYRVESKGKYLGSIDFAGDAKETSVTFYLPPQVGDLAPNVELVDLKSGRVTRLSEFRGKVVWLEFWATWCGPCQQPMQELVELCAERRSEWSERVAVLPVSIDDDAETATAHLDARSWTGVEHVWAASKDNVHGFDAPAVRQFGVVGVPTAILIDADGRIAWIGHPQGSSEVARMIDGQL